MQTSKLVAKEVAEAKANGTLKPRKAGDLKASKKAKTPKAPDMVKELQDTLNKAVAKVDPEKAKGNGAKKVTKAEAADKAADAKFAKAAADVTVIVKHLEGLKAEDEKSAADIMTKADETRLQLRNLKSGDEKNALRERIIAVRQNARKQLRKFEAKAEKQAEKKAA